VSIWVFSLVKHPLVLVPAPIQESKTNQKTAKPPPIARIDSNAPFVGKNLPNTTMIGAAAKLKIGMSQAHSIRSAPLVSEYLPFHQVDFIKVDRRPVTEHPEDYSQSQTYLRCGNGDYEYGDQLAIKVGESTDPFHMRSGGDQVDVHCVQHQLDGHHYKDRGTAGQNTIQSNDEQDGAKELEPD
jgi:hypothetical protein